MAEWQKSTKLRNISSQNGMLRLSLEGEVISFSWRCSIAPPGALCPVGSPDLKLLPACTLKVRGRQ